MQTDTGKFLERYIGNASGRDRRHLSKPSLSIRILAHKFLPESILHYRESSSVLRRRGNNPTTVGSPSHSNSDTESPDIFPFGADGFSLPQSHPIGPNADIFPFPQNRPQAGKDSDIFPFGTPQPQVFKATTSREPDSPARKLASMTSTLPKVADSPSSPVSSSSGISKSGHSISYSGSGSHRIGQSNSQSSGSSEKSCGTPGSCHYDPMSSENSKCSLGAHGIYRPGKAPACLRMWRSDARFPNDPNGILVTLHVYRGRSKEIRWAIFSCGKTAPAILHYIESHVRRIDPASTKIVLAAPRRGVKTARAAERLLRNRYGGAQLQLELVRV